MLRLRSNIVLTALMVAIIGSASSAYASPATDKREALTQAMRKLWADHVVWTRLYIIAAVNGSPDAQPAADRLLKNQADIGQAIVPYYGADAGKKLTELLKQL